MGSAAAPEGAVKEHEVALHWSGGAHCEGEEAQWSNGEPDEVDVEAKEWLAARRFFAVLGAMKGGTCALRSHLRAVDWDGGLSLPSQEPHHFDDDEDFARGAAYYASWFRWWGEWKWPYQAGDVTPSYLYIPSAVPRLRKLIPHAKLVVLLRNPVDRALSQHNHDLAKCRPVGRLRERVELELERQDPPSRADVFGRGLYFAQLQRVLESFPREQLLVIVSERYRSHTKREFRRICAFLELSCQWQPRHLPEKHVRRTYTELLLEADRRALAELYTEDVQQLKHLLDDPLPEWRDFCEPNCSSLRADETAKNS